MIPALLVLSVAKWGKPSVWRVTGDRAGELWLLGSVHNLRQENYSLPPDVDRLYQRADIVVIELDLQQEGDELLQQDEGDDVDGEPKKLKQLSGSETLH